MYYPLKVVRINKETSLAVSVEFEVPEENKQLFSFTPGQFLTLKKTINGEDVRRSYSICSTPKSGKLVVAIKKIENGLFSSFAVDSLKEGDVIEVGVPAGKFTLSCKSDNANEYLFIAAGSGITPTLSMVKTILEDEPQSKVQLVYGNKSPQETIFHREVSQLQGDYESFKLSMVYSASEVGDATPCRISYDKLKTLVSNFSSLEGVYLCGPEDMINSISDSLKVDVPELEGKINFELFTSSASTDTIESVVDIDFTESKVTATVDDVDYTFMVKAGKNILAAALSAGIDVPYSCQGGVCGTCECTVKEGKVALGQNMVLSEEEVEEGQTLMCQATPSSAEVKLDFDF